MWLTGLVVWICLASDPENECQFSEPDLCMGKHMEHIYCIFLSWKLFLSGQTLPLSFKDDSSFESSHRVSHYGLCNGLTLMLFYKLSANNFYARDTTRPLKLLSGTEML